MKKIIKVQTNLITDPEDVMFGKYIHVIDYDDGSFASFSSNDVDIKTHIDAIKYVYDVMDKIL